MKESLSLKIARPYLGERVHIKIDRSLGSMHPKYSFVYQLNYGYVEGVDAPDGEELDAYLLGVEEPMEEAEGLCIAVIHRKDDDDDKLVLIAIDDDPERWSDKKILDAVHFQEQWFEPTIIRE